MFITFLYKLVHNKNPSAEKCGETARFIASARECAERVSGILLRCEFLPGANEVAGHDRGRHYLLSTYYSSTV